MRILELSDDQEQALIEIAAASGLGLEDWLRSLAAGAKPAVVVRTKQDLRTREILDQLAREAYEGGYYENGHIPDGGHE
jgi:hypothetical protein